MPTTRAGRKKQANSSNVDDGSQSDKQLKNKKSKNTGRFTFFSPPRTRSKSRVRFSLTSSREHSYRELPSSDSEEETTNKDPTTSSTYDYFGLDVTISDEGASTKATNCEGMTGQTVEPGLRRSTRVAMPSKKQREANESLQLLARQSIETPKRHSHPRQAKGGPMAHDEIDGLSNSFMSNVYVNDDDDEESLFDPEATDDNDEDEVYPSTPHQATANRSRQQAFLSHDTPHSLATFPSPSMFAQVPNNESSESESEPFPVSKAKFVGLFSSLEERRALQAKQRVKPRAKQQKVGDFARTESDLRGKTVERLMGQAMDYFFQFSKVTTPPQLDIHCKPTLNWLIPLPLFLVVDDRGRQGRTNKRPLVVIASRDAETWNGTQKLLQLLYFQNFKSTKFNVIVSFCEEDANNAIFGDQAAVSPHESPSTELLQTIFNASRCPSRVVANDATGRQPVESCARIFKDVHGSAARKQLQLLFKNFFKYVTSTTVPQAAQESWKPPTPVLIVADPYKPVKRGGKTKARTADNHDHRPMPIVTIATRDDQSWERAKNIIEELVLNNFDESNDLPFELQVCYTRDSIDEAFGTSNSASKALRLAKDERNGNIAPVMGAAVEMTPMR